MLREEAIDADLVTLALERYETPLVHYAISILGDIERAREVVQDTFLKLCREKTGRARNHLAQWLFTVCRNRAFDVRRKDSRMRSLRAADLATGPASGPRPLGALKQLEQEEKLREVLEVIATLGEKEREVLALKFHCDLSYKEISEVTHLSVSYVGVLIHNGVKQIRRRLEPAPSDAPSLVRRLP